MPDPHAETFVIPDGASVSNSIREGMYSLVAIRTPAMTAATVYLYFETTEDTHPDDDPVNGVADAAATWDPVFDYANAAVRVTISATAARRIQLDTTKFQRLGRVRVKAMQTDGTTVQAQTGTKTIKPKFKRI